MPKRSKESKNGSDLPHLFGYAVEIDQHLVEREESYERFGPWSESYSTNFRKVSRTTSHPDIVSSLNIREGEPCFVLWASYSTGDSFGWADGKGIDIIAIFADLKAAKELSAFLADVSDKGGYRDASLDPESSKLKFTTSDGQNHVLSPAWFGHFERLSSLNIEQTVMCEYTPQPSWHAPLEF